MEGGIVSAVVGSLSAGVPILALHLAVTLGLLGLGVVVYMWITPFHERVLIAQGNVAGGLVSAGSIVALAIPLAATLAASRAALDILVWGLVAVILQLITFAIAIAVFRDLRTMIERGNVAAALVLVAVQLAVALLNAGALVG